MRESEVVSVIRHDVKPGHEADPAEGSRLYTIVLHFETLEQLRGSC